MGSNRIGQRLYQRRTEKGLTLQELAVQSGVHTTHIGRIEKGERFPSAKILLKLAEPLGFSESDLLKLAGYLSPDATDDRIAKFKAAMRGEINVAMANLLDKVDSL